MNAERIASTYFAAKGAEYLRLLKELKEFEQTIRHQVAEEDRFDPVCRECGEALTSYELVCDECREIGRTGVKN